MIRILEIKFLVSSEKKSEGINCYATRRSAPKKQACKKISRSRLGKRSLWKRLFLLMQDRSLCDYELFAELSRERARASLVTGELSIIKLCYLFFGEINWFIPCMGCALWHTFLAKLFVSKKGILPACLPGIEIDENMLDCLIYWTDIFGFNF